MSGNVTVYDIPIYCERIKNFSQNSTGGVINVVKDDDGQGVLHVNVYGGDINFPTGVRMVMDTRAT